jgi:hypothetical protein
MATGNAIIIVPCALNQTCHGEYDGSVADPSCPLWIIVISLKVGQSVEGIHGHSVAGTPYTLKIGDINIYGFVDAQNIDEHLAQIPCVLTFVQEHTLLDYVLTKPSFKLDKLSLFFGSVESTVSLYDPLENL